MTKQLKFRKFPTKGVLKMSAVLEKEQKPQKLNCLSNARYIIRKTMKERGLSSEEVRRSFLEIRYGKQKS